MLIYHRTSILESNAQTAVNTINCVGVMGKGIAAAYKARYPLMFATYKELCAKKALEPGKLWLWKGPEQWILNFPTKLHWRNPSKISWIEAGLKKFAAEFQQRGISDIAFPRLGCGNGNLDWADVKPLMERYLVPLPINIYVHDYEVDIGLPEHLEAVAARVGNSNAFDGTFLSFVRDIEIVLSTAGGDLTDILSKVPFNASFLEDRLTIGSGAHKFVLEQEDLRSIWVMLTSGLLTEKKLHWFFGDQSGPILTLSSLLPCTRLVQVQRPSASQPEYAVEYRRRPGSVRVGDSGEQLNLAWA